MTWLSRLIIAAVVAFVVYLVCIFFGGLLAMVNMALVQYVGSFIREWALAVAIAAFVWAFFYGPRVTL